MFGPVIKLVSPLGFLYKNKKPCPIPLTFPTPLGPYLYTRPLPAQSRRNSKNCPGDTVNRSWGRVYRSLGAVNRRSPSALSSRSMPSSPVLNRR
jgi:hypothetical protein